MCSRKCQQIKNIALDIRFNIFPEVVIFLAILETAYVDGYVVAIARVLVVMAFLAGVMEAVEFITGLGGIAVPDGVMFVV